MEIGIFLPIAKGGFIISKNVPPTWPTWALNRDVTLKCESLGFDFALSMVKFRGFGGETEYWDHALDSFTLTASLAPITSKIQLIPSVTNLSLHPAVAARMASTIEAVCPSRFGLNIVSGWFKEEFNQNNNYNETLKLCHSTVGVAILNTSITIVFGFSILVFSNFIPTIYFGVFTGIAMLLAMISVLTLLPSLILLFKPFGEMQN